MTGGRDDEETTAEAAAIRCAACQDPILLASGKPNLSPFHSCAQCKGGLHAVSLCDHVWMPEDNWYFCSAECIRKRNAAMLLRSSVAGEHVEDEDGDSEPEIQPHVFRVARRPEEDEDAKGMLQDEPTKETTEEDGTFVSLAQEMHEEENENWLEEDDLPRQEQEECESDDTSKSDSEGEHVEGSEPRDPPPAVIGRADPEIDELIKEDTRIQIAFKQGHSDTEGRWWGGLMGGRTADGQHIYVGYDDGELQFHSYEELVDLHNKKKFKMLSSSDGILRDEVVTQKALGFSQLRLANKFVPIGVLLGSDTEERLCNQWIYTAHVLSLRTAHELKDIEYIGLRSNRKSSKNKTNDPRLGYHTFRRGDVVKWIGEEGPIKANDSEVIEEYHEIVYGVLVYFQRAQQRRFLITYDKSLCAFSYNSWVAWTRCLKDGTIGDVDEDSEDRVETATPDVVEAMRAAWADMKTPKPNSLDILQKWSYRGPARVAVEAAKRKREDDRLRKEETRKRSRAAKKKQSAPPQARKKPDGAGKQAEKTKKKAEKSARDDVSEKSPREELHKRMQEELKQQLEQLEQQRLLLLKEFQLQKQDLAAHSKSILCAEEVQTKSQGESARRPMSVSPRDTTHDLGKNVTSVQQHKEQKQDVWQRMRAEEKACIDEEQVRLKVRQQLQKEMWSGSTSSSSASSTKKQVANRVHGGPWVVEPEPAALQRPGDDFMPWHGMQSAMARAEVARVTQERIENERAARVREVQLRAYYGMPPI